MSLLLRVFITFLSIAYGMSIRARGCRAGVPDAGQIQQIVFERLAIGAGVHHRSMENRLAGKEWESSGSIHATRVRNLLWTGL
jgi:hypothetical protein